LQQLQGISPQAGSTLLLKSDNGQFQLLRIGPAPTGGSQGLTTSGNQTIRLQTVPAVSRFTGPPLALRKTIVTQQVKQKQNVNFFSLFFLMMILFWGIFLSFFITFFGKCFFVSG
jgi:transcription initiation factor TFIID subunit 4